MISQSVPFGKLPIDPRSPLAAAVFLQLTNTREEQINFDIRSERNIKAELASTSISGPRIIALLLDSVRDIPAQERKKSDTVFQSLHLEFAEFLEGIDLKTLDDMHYNLDGNVSTAASVSTSGMHPVVSSMHHEMLASHDPVVSLQAQLMMDTLRQPFSSSSPSMVTPPRLIPSAYDTHRVPGSPASLHGYPAVTSYSPLVAADVETPSPGGCVPSPHTPRNAVKNLLAEQKMKTEPTSTPPPEEELAKYFDIKPLLRKVSEETNSVTLRVCRADFLQSLWVSMFVAVYVPERSKMVRKMNNVFVIDV